MVAGIKESLFLTTLDTIDELKKSIVQNIATIAAEMFRTLVYSIQESLLLVQGEIGGYIQHVR